ncbi:hypothetical protein [Cylindrospermum sp. FACHB-282]|uniref:hypothetical protein n=1 Tax=Cylindrospermum sp. FACHB-282 TaxID=2692794 RepID=UPI001684E502|nr:hypothetical protein [Cylindrospermum sp. FACHB-282]MBD2383964.1 hypothetical protein [Cylindrospermum sp. FACHB-282]
MSREKIHIIIHEDGSLRPEDILTLQSSLPCSVISREEADSLIIPQLANYQACLEYRQKHVFGLKLFDITLLETDILAYCDTDILFLKPFSGLFNISHFAADAVFMEDCREAYALRPWHLWPIGPEKLPAKINAGLICFDTSKFDLDRINYFLKKYRDEDAFVKHHAWIEQTCWAVAASKLRCKIYDPLEFIISNPGTLHRFEQTTAIHFVSLHRKLISQVKEPDSEKLNLLEPQTVNVKIPRRATSYSLFRSAMLGRMGYDG